MGLSVDGVDTRTLHGISFSVEDGDALAVLGDNGSGRTSLLKTVAGTVPATAGSIHWRDADITRASAARRVEMGIRMVAGSSAVFPRLTVADNLLTGCHQFAWDRPRVRARIDTVLAGFPALAGRLAQLAGSLSGGEQSMLAIAAALVGEPSLLLLDEPTLGLAANAADSLAATLRRLRADGLTLVVVERSDAHAQAFADRSIVLARGAITR